MEEAIWVLVVWGLYAAKNGRSVNYAQILVCVGVRWKDQDTVDLTVTGDSAGCSRHYAGAAFLVTTDLRHHAEPYVISILNSQSVTRKAAPA